MTAPSDTAAIEGGVSIASLRRIASVRLRAAGLDEADTDIRVLLGHALGMQDADLHAASAAPVADDARARFEGYLARRIAGESVARIIGQKEFWSLPFRLNSETLVPRPETESVVEAALAATPDRNARLSVLDLGTGTGILLAAILAERPYASGIGVDRSEGALAVARANLQSLGLGKRAQFVAGDWGAALGGMFDLVVCNPPYVAAREFEQLPLDVRKHDPHLALDGGEDGLDAYRALIPDLERLLNGEGVAVLELGRGQEPAVAGLAHAAGLVVATRARPDLAGIPRAMTLIRGS